MKTNLNIEGFVRQSKPAFRGRDCYFVASKNKEYYLIKVDIDNMTFCEQPLDISYEGDERQKSAPLHFAESNRLEFRCESGFYLLDLNGKVVKCSKHKSNIPEKGNIYRINTKTISYDTKHFQDDEWVCATTQFREATIVQNDSEILKIRFGELYFDGISLIDIIDGNIVLQYHDKIGYEAYLICNLNKKVINIYYFAKRPICNDIEVMTEGWEKGNTYEDCKNVYFSSGMKRIVFWGTDGRLKSHPINDMNYALENKKTLNIYPEIIYVGNNLQVFKSHWEDGYYKYAIRVKCEGEWKKRIFKIREVDRLFINAGENVYAICGRQVNIFVREYSFENTIIEFESPRKPLCDFSNSVDFGEFDDM